MLIIVLIILFRGAFVAMDLQLPVQSVSIITNVNLNPAHGEVYLIQHYVVKCVGDLWQVSGFLHQ
jgi:hypothetical protein